MHKDSYERGTALLEAMVAKSSVILRQLGSQYSEERAYGRFLDNPRISFSDILEVYRPPNSVDYSGRHILILNDTTEVSFGLEPDKKKLGKVGNGAESGFFLHPAIGIDAQTGGCLGLASASVYRRAEYEATEAELAKAEASLRKSAAKKLTKDLTLQDKTGTEIAAAIAALEPIKATKILSFARDRYQRTLPFEEKNRYRWLETATEGAAYYSTAGQKTVVADCESDIFHVFVGLIARKLDFVIRSYQDRDLEYNKSGLDLRTQARNWSIECCYKVKLPKTDKRSAHEAILNVSYQKITLACPAQAAKEPLKLPILAGQTEPTLITMPNSLTLYAVRVSEDPQSVVHNEQPIEWLLLTSHEVENCEQALQIIQFYCWRWTIEQLFRTFKSQGLNIQKSTVENYDALTKLALLALIAATQIMQLVQARNGQTEQKTEEVFDETEAEVIAQLNKQLEGKTVKQKNPHPPLSLAFAAWVMARLGGWKPNASPRPPGPITILNGTVIFHNIVRGYKLNAIPMDP